MSIAIDLVRGEMVIKPILICADCGNEIANVGADYSSGRRHPDTLLKCGGCEKEGKIRGDRWRTTIPLYKKFHLLSETAEEVEE